ncbi:MAG: ABC-2 family transporter protein [Candidatus Woesearchaeota archaeon]
MIGTFIYKSLKASSKFRANVMFATLFMVVSNLTFMFSLLYITHQTNGFGLITTQQAIMAFTIANCAYVFGLVFFRGIVHLQKLIINGHLDTLLIRPVSIYKHILVYELNPYALGEIITVIIFLLLIPPQDIPIVLFYSLCSAILLHCVVLICNTLPFFIDTNKPIAFWDTIITFMFYPTYMTPFYIKIITFLVLPGALMSFGPIFAMQHPMVAFYYFTFVIGSVVLAYTLFTLGIKRYRSAGI